MLYNNDCLNILSKMNSNSVDMIYLDPPFYTQKIQTLTNSNGKEYNFDDKWISRNQYIDYLKKRLLLMKYILKESGNIFLHCDSTASAYLKVLMDDIFGENNFRSEIIWTYKRWTNSQKKLIPNHQTIFHYTKTDNYKFYTIYGDYSLTTNIDQILQERERNDIGKSVYKKDSNGNIVMCKQKKGVPLSDVWEIPYFRKTLSLPINIKIV